MNTCFLTSNPMSLDAEEISRENGFAERLRAALPAESSVLFVCSDPEHPAETDHYADGMRQCFLNSGFRFSAFKVLDGRNEADAETLVRNADLIILAGGHVPTQNAFFQKIMLRSLLKNTNAVILGFSAGSMNMAKTVYAHPELAGEAIDPYFQRFIPGLGLTDCMILPHYQAIKNDVLDGLRVFEDIAYPDSMGREFYVLVDGSYIELRDDRETLYGEGYLIKDGALNQISENNGICLLKNSSVCGR